MARGIRLAVSNIMTRMLTVSGARLEASSDFVIMFSLPDFQILDQSLVICRFSAHSSSNHYLIASELERIGL